MKQSILFHLQHEYLTLPQLSQQSELSFGEIEILISANCVPPHSYFVTEEISIHDPLTQHTGKQVTKYYHPSVVRWLKQAKTLQKELGLEKAAACIKDDFFKQYADHFKGQRTPGCENVLQAWQYFLDGTWGVCLQDISVSCMAQKELARLHIQQLTRLAKESALKQNQLQDLSNAIVQYLQAAKEFIPYFQANSSYCKEVMQAQALLLKEQ